LKIHYLALLVPSAYFPQEVATTLKNYEPILENEEVRVGRVTLEAGESEGLHRHPYPRVLVALEKGMIAVKRQDGFSTGSARFGLPDGSTRDASVSARSKPSGKVMKPTRFETRAAHPSG